MPDYDTVLLHEIGHATGHRTRLDRSLGHSFGSPGYAKEELRAEISAAMNARVLGIAFDPERVGQAERGDSIGNAASYLASWLGALPENERKSELMAAIGAAQGISDFVLGFVTCCKEDVEENATAKARPAYRLTR